ACIKNTEAAARLLRGAAHFFRTVGEQDESYAEQMNDNADVYEQMAQLVETNPEGTINMDASLNRGEAVGRSQDQNRSENSSPENTKDHFTEARTNISADAVRRLFPRTSHESMPPEDQKEFINLVSPINRKHTIDGNSAIIERTGLPFYKNTYLIEVRDKSWQPGTG
ncbi:MAG: hypothetical protein KDK27_21675, partial [Leptospiraceae bacterium]|nr:hypothetical protein [Leptospiraceae bacterium]